MTEQIDFDQIAKQICSKQKLELIAKVGRGSFKETFRIRIPEGHQYALKIYRSAEISNRTQREIDAMLRCNHPGIARIMNIDIHEEKERNYLYILEEYFEGGTLADLVKNNGTLDRTRLLQLGTDLIDSLSHLHSLDLVHRYIKPENIVFRLNSPLPIITDFGIVRDLKAVSETSSWLPRGPGTPYFASPEQLNNDKNLIDWRSDQFSLAITLFVCCSGLHPFMHEGNSDEQTVLNVENREPLSPYFYLEVEKTGLTSLPRMLSPWPVQRFRLPSDLKESWALQRK